jgi:hypothetical protein
MTIHILYHKIVAGLFAAFTYTIIFIQSVLNPNSIDEIYYLQNNKYYKMDKYSYYMLLSPYKYHLIFKRGPCYFIRWTHPWKYFKNDLLNNNKYNSCVKVTGAYILPNANNVLARILKKPSDNKKKLIIDSEEVIFSLYVEEKDLYYKNSADKQHLYLYCLQYKSDLDNSIISKLAVDYKWLVC